MSTLNEASKAYGEILYLAGGIEITADMFADNMTGDIEKGLYGIAAMAKSIQSHLETIEQLIAERKEQEDSGIE